MEKKLSLSALTALVLSSVFGAGVFGLPQNTVIVTSPTALLISQAITGAGILLLVFTILILTRIRSELDGGAFTYACEGFGGLVDFYSAWGYWLCAVIANVSYLVIIFSAFNLFTDAPELRLFGDNNTRQSIVGASVLLQIIRFLVLRGVQTAVSINLVITLVKLLPLGLFIMLAFMLFKLDTLTFDFTGVTLGVPVWEQVKNTMLIILWIFIGVEGAAVVSTHVRDKRDAGHTVLLAIFAALGVYLLVTLPSLGVVARPELAEVRNPSAVGLMVRTMGPWGEIIIAAGLIVPVCGTYLGRIIMAVEVPLLASAHRAFPRISTRQNTQGAPSASLWLTNICVQICLALIWLTGLDYSTLLTVASEMILVPYLLVGALLLKTITRPVHKAVGIGASTYGLWLLYASGPMHLLLFVVLCAPGLLIFLYAHKTHVRENVLKRQGMALIDLLPIAAVPATWMLMG